MRRPRKKLLVWAAALAVVAGLWATALYAALAQPEAPAPAAHPGPPPGLAPRDDGAGADEESEDGEDDAIPEDDDEDEDDDEEDEDDEDDTEDVDGPEGDEDTRDREPNASSTPSSGSDDVSEAAAIAETDPVPHGDDAADDPAIWVNPTDPSLSTVIGTDKRGGLAVYDLSGRQLQYVADGEPNNVDLRPGFSLGGRRVTLVGASDRAANRIALYQVDPRTRRLVRVAAPGLEPGIDVYGFCLYRSGRNGTFYAVVTSKSGEIEQWALVGSGAGVEGRRVRTLSVGSQTEGCVADDELGHLYLGEEGRGIWKYGAEPNAGGARTLVDPTGGRLVADVEGLAIAPTGPGAGYLIASSQGNDTYVVYRREARNAYVKTFRIPDARTDATEETDGIDVTTASLGRRLRGGLFVAQDGRNDRGNQNFKLVPWRSILGGG